MVSHRAEVPQYVAGNGGARALDQSSVHLPQGQPIPRPAAQRHLLVRGTWTDACMTFLSMKGKRGLTGLFHNVGHFERESTGTVNLPQLAPLTCHHVNQAGCSYQTSDLKL